MDFIVKLPQSAGHDSIMVVVNSITKRANFVSTVTMISAAGAAHLFLNHVWKHHGLPRKVVSDRGLQFVAEFTQELYRLLGIEVGSHHSLPPSGRWTDGTGQPGTGTISPSFHQSKTR